MIITQQIKKLPTYIKPEAPLPYAQIDLSWARWIQPTFM